jgi:hypothetical protein
MTRGSTARVVIFAAAVGAPFGCNDATHDDQVSALGPEDPAVPRGPDHRPNQPCLVCHGGLGPAKQQFSIGGTIYAVQGQSAPAKGATVQIKDITGAVVTAQSNEAGNFYITVQEWIPTYPTLPTVTLGSMSQTMTTHVGRDGSCASCHLDPPSATQAGHIWVAPSAAP